MLAISLKLVGNKRLQLAVLEQVQAAVLFRLLNITCKLVMPNGYQCHFPLM